ncbi:D-alanyl-D-alanine carboxypeptidase/D-alanyl-D-alanine-endopeptidase [Xenophilus arseniciresistens]|uniref:D-alanyl-D-alanine carboxypeptidase/D-alanyl-D-alanine-endopeptidase n=1 Tax=Xenophilus arseniciresistens TaxID=1283306 RepID=A0AAE3T1G8_9BURK|nr:D-alanyl-D-alanine carboxypeptidase/D-alanyl-D-alanine-endopeptidase [Xenophilus arseniciresistens]MDA7419209.1 D-alanyl-D-alanine carboxypeptidase/D-alanyl-D-alanine-endopeptidase [Xenophilus arseniciresistens]
MPLMTLLAPLPYSLRAALAAAAAFFCLLPALAQNAPAGRLQALPPEVEAALARAKVPRESVTLLVADAEGLRPPRLAWRAQESVNPASIMKVVTTYAALDLLGPAFNWSTPVYVDGPVIDGTLRGNLYIQGRGDPSLVLERLWLLLRRVQGMGIRTIAGDIVLDRSAFDPSVESDPAAFDGEPLRPYNAAPDALLLNFRSVAISFMPDRHNQVAHLRFDPPLAGVAVQQSVPLTAGECGAAVDWRAGLRADFSDPLRMVFAGGLPAACGERSWSVAYADPRSYALRAVGGLWGEMGGVVTGQMRHGSVPAGLKPAFEMQSPALAEVIRDINKYSNNVMAQQVFLTLALQQRPRHAASFEDARTVIRQWWNDRIGTGEGQPVFDNGAGLSRQERLSAAALAKMLQVAWRSPAMSELMASLPAIGVDGTLRRRQLRSGGSAHLKTGTLRDSSGIAGFVDGASGRRWVLVAIANDPNAVAARPAFDALVDWATRDQ